MALWVFSLLFLAFTGHASALYCLCKNGVGTEALQSAMDYACGNGADCSPIKPNGPCYLPNTVQDHCNYAVNSFYQRKVSSGGTCDFSGAATTSSTPPSTASSGCVYPSSASIAGTGTTPPSGVRILSSTGEELLSPVLERILTPPSAGGTPPFFPDTPGSTNVYGISPPFSTGSDDDMGAAVARFEGTYTKLLLPLVLTTLCLAFRV